MKKSEKARPNLDRVIYSIAEKEKLTPRELIPKVILESGEDRENVVRMILRMLNDGQLDITMKNRYVVTRRRYRSSQAAAK